MSRFANLVRRVYRRVVPAQESVEVAGSIIPSPDRRWCGPEFKDDDYYLRSAEAEATRLVRDLGCTPESRVFDVGCGQGRLPIGLLRVVGEVRYLGADIHRESIDWCRRHIQQHHPSYRFQHLDVHNERYNREGVRLDDGFRFEVPDRSIDIIYLYSVFSHTTEEDLRVYLGDFRRVLAEGGRAFFTGFVEEDVPDLSINPAGHRLKCSGPLHVVRYNRRYLFSILNECGFSVLRFDNGVEADGQSGIYLEVAP